MSVEDIIKKVFKDTWQIFSNKFVVLILGTLLAFVLMIFIVTIPPLIFGIYYLCFQLIHGKDARVSDIFKGFDYFFRSWGLFILVALGILVGLVFLIVPGVLLMIVWQYAFAISIIENKGVIDSLKGSYNLAKDNFAFSAIFWILMLILSSIGGVVYFGLLISTPFMILATCIAVKVLSKNSKMLKKKK